MAVSIHRLTHFAVAVYAAVGAGTGAPLYPWSLSGHVELGASWRVVPCAEWGQPVP